MGREENSMDHKPQGLPLFIGSLPFGDHGQALAHVLDRSPQSPHWVQLPVHPQENFLVQCSEGLPGLRVGSRVCVENQGDQFERELLGFYEEYLAVTEGRLALESSRFVMSQEAAPGLHRLIGALEGKPMAAFVKGQLSGPLSVLTGLQDSESRWAYYDERVREAMVKLLCLRARWQTRRLRGLGHTTLLFVDEPTLGNLGSSALIGISPEVALQDLREILAAVEVEGGWPGVHVCANADWGRLLALRELRVLSFDAFSYFERVALFKEQLVDFLGRGGILAWGVVPTQAEELDRVTVQGLVDGWISKARDVACGELELAELLNRSFITPACGLGSLDVPHAIKAMDLTVEVSDGLRARLGLGPSGRAG
jgi:hypothetical protein